MTGVHIMDYSIFEDDQSACMSCTKCIRSTFPYTSEQKELKSETTHIIFMTACSKDTM